MGAGADEVLADVLLVAPIGRAIGAQQKLGAASDEMVTPLMVTGSGSGPGVK
jgi:hypothetical protein